MVKEFKIMSFFLILKIQISLLESFPILFNNSSTIQSLNILFWFFLKYYWYTKTGNSLIKIKKIYNI